MPKRHKQPLDYQHLEAYLGIQFHDGALLIRALTHCSHGAEHMERLEFLGDAVLGLVIAEYLHDFFPHETEGQLSRFRAGLVCKESLYEVAKSWRLETYLQVGLGERSAQGVKSPSIVANAVEAVIGAVFKDIGWLAAQNLVLQAWRPLLNKMDVSDARDAKSRLQEYTQGKGWGLPVYEVQDLGVGYTPRFEALCRVREKVCGKGMGERKKIAELQAAQQAWDIFFDKMGVNV